MLTLSTVESRLRFFLLLLSAFICIGTIAELLLIGHTESISQFSPFVLSGLVFCTVIATLLSPRRPVLLALRIVAAAAIAGSLFGVYKHITGNLAFLLEIQPSATVGDVFWKSLGGVSPLMAPGILALAALVALIATYAHPVLREQV